MKVYISFGQDHRHVIDGVVYDRNCLASIECSSHNEGRARAFELFGPVFCTSYDEKDLPRILPRFPRGVVATEGRWAHEIG